jgi:hypothetical protein
MVCPLLELSNQLTSFSAVVTTPITWYYASWGGSRIDGARERWTSQKTSKDAVIATGKVLS